MSRGNFINNIGRGKAVSFFLPTKFEVRVARESNVDINTAVDNGSVLDGITLATNDFVTLYGQTNAAENGIYIVQASGAPLRHPDYDTPQKLQTARWFSSPLRNANNAGLCYFQIASDLTDFADQVWSQTPPPIQWQVPNDADSIIGIEGLGGGGGGGIGRQGSDGGNVSGGGGGGGAGTIPAKTDMRVVPGETLTIGVGQGGDRNNPGGTTYVSGTFGIVEFYGAEAGTGGGSGSSAGPAGNDYIVAGILGLPPIMVGGGGAAGAGQPGTGGSGAASTSDNIFTTSSASGGAGGGPGYNGGGGGGGAPGIGIGGAGGRNSQWPSSIWGTPGSPAPEGNFGAGGGGGGGGAEISSGPGGEGGVGMDGFLIIRL